MASAPPRAPPRPSIASPPPTPSDLTLCVTPSRPQLAAIAAPRPARGDCRARLSARYCTGVAAARAVYSNATVQNTAVFM